MSTETPFPITAPPGIVLSQSPAASENRWTFGSWVRFWRGHPEKIGGYALLTLSAMIGIGRAMKAWSDQTSRLLMAVGTNIKLYYVSNDALTPIDITPWAATTTQANPISTTAGAVNVNVYFPSHGAVVGQYLDISNVSAVDNFSPAGSWPIVAITDANNVSIQAPAAAINSVTGGGAAVALGLELPPMLQDPAGGFGWGAGTWGSSTWGTPRSSTTISFTPGTWTLGAFGKILISCPVNGGIYSFDPTAYPQVRAAVIPTAPTFNTGILVTSELIVIAYGSNYNSSLVGAGSNADQDLMQWWSSAQGDYNNWDTTAVYGENGAPSRVGRLKEGTRIVGAADLGNHVALFWTDTALYQFQYTGSNYVFDITLAGRECGLMAPHAFVTVGTQAFWFGPNGFFMFNGGVGRIPNHQDVSDYVIRLLKPYYTAKSFCWFNQKYNEVWFAFVPNSSTEPTQYVAVNIDEWTWTTGEFPGIPTAFTACDKFGGDDPRPIICGTDGNLYQMENGLDANGLSIPWSIGMDGIEPGEGEYWTEINGIAMDMERHAGPMTVAITAYDRTPYDWVPVDSGSAIVEPSDNLDDFRVSGRVFTLSFSGTGVGCDFRLGIPKLLWNNGGMRR